MLVTDWVEGDQLVRAEPETIAALVPLGVECFCWQLLELGQHLLDLGRVEAAPPRRGLVQLAAEVKRVRDEAAKNKARRLRYIKDDKEVPPPPVAERGSKSTGASVRFSAPVAGSGSSRRPPVRTAREQRARLAPRRPLTRRRLVGAAALIDVAGRAVVRRVLLVEDVLQNLCV